MEEIMILAPSLTFYVKQKDKLQRVPHRETGEKREGERSIYTTAELAINCILLLKELHQNPSEGSKPINYLLHQKQVRRG